MNNVIKSLIFLALFPSLAFATMQGDGVDGIQGGNGDPGMQGIGASGPPASSFLPTDIAETQLWWDPASGITESGGTVSSWVPKGVQTNAAVEAVVADQPSFIASDSDFNNEPVVDCNGSNGDQDRHLAQTSITQINQPFFVMATFMIDSAPTYQGRLWARSTTVTQRQTSSLVIAEAGTDLLYITTLPSTEPIIVSMLFNGASSEIWENGVSQATGNAGTGVLTGSGSFGITLCNTSGTILTRGFDGRLAGLVIISKNPSNTEHDDLGNYFSTRYDGSWTNQP